MAVGILRTCLVLLAVVSLNQPSGKHGAVPEESEETLQRMKARELTLRLHQLRLEREMAELEATQEAPAPPAPPAPQVERKIQRHTGAVLGLVIPALFMLHRQHRQGARAEHFALGHAAPGPLGQAHKGMAFVISLSVLLRAIAIGTGRALGYLCVGVSRLLRLLFKSHRPANKDLVFY